MTGIRFLTGSHLPLPEDAVLPPFHVPWCFGCGPENEHGLGLAARIEDDTIVADMAFERRFQGGPGVVHGGAIAAFFDDLMGFVPVAHRTPAVTARFEVNYRRPLPLGAPLKGEAWLSAREGRKLWAESVGRAEGSEPFIEARALYLQIGAGHFEDTIAGMPEEDRSRLERFRSDEYYP